MKSTTLTTLATLGFLAMSGNAFADADNYTAFNGTGCDNYYAADTGQFNHQYNGIRNISASARYVSCPIDKDAVSSLGGFGTTWIRWIGAGTMYCTLYHFNVNGVGVSQGGNGPQNWFSIPPLAADDFWGSASLYCLVPAGATLQTIHVYEP
ncbi:MAG: hypothetical protein ACREU9_01715 [Gammaproteobacteria bacterium]